VTENPDPRVCARCRVGAHDHCECQCDVCAARFDGPARNEPWEDEPDEWSEAIHESFPTRSGSHETYATALKMVGHRYSKGQLVALVNWLLVRVDALEREKEIYP
jgi:hypothetical protein